MSASSSNCSATSAFRGRASAMRAMIGAVPRVTICLPTYNERENLERMLHALCEVLPADGAVLVIEMDCDFSHDPADVPRLLAAAQQADLVLGSRYVEGGGVRNWGRLRRIVSAGGSTYARVI